jgi:muramoyltetrapeptide carboxypeptidase
VTKPPALKKGSRLAIVSPASTPKPDLTHAGADALRALGYEPVLFPHALSKGPLYYAGTARQRADDLQSAFADPTIDAVICTRGGWGSAELLPLLDSKIFRAHPKPFIAYSDHTTLHTWLQQHCGLVTFHGPMVAADFSRQNAADIHSWTSALTAQSPWNLAANSGLRPLQTGTATGTLRGGCLSILAESLGTPFAFAPPDDTILFLEDIAHKPYQWDRQLQHLRFAGVLDAVKGIILGDMAQCVSTPQEAELLEQAIRHALADFKGPIAIGLRSGHVNGANITLPLGVQVSLDIPEGNPQLHFLEPAVTV